MNCSKLTDVLKCKYSGNQSFHRIVFALVSVSCLTTTNRSFPAEPNFIGSCCCFLFFPIFQRTQNPKSLKGLPHVLPRVVLSADTVGPNHLTAFRSEEHTS